MLVSSVPYKRKKVRNFFWHFCTEILRILAFFLPPKTGIFVSAKNRRQLRFTAACSGMSHKSRRKLAELRRRTFFFFINRKSEKKCLHQRDDLFFFLEITMKPNKKDEKNFSIFTLSLERLHYFQHFRRR